MRPSHRDRERQDHVVFTSFRVSLLVFIDQLGRGPGPAAETPSESDLDQFPGPTGNPDYGPPARNYGPPWSRGPGARAHRTEEGLSLEAGPAAAGGASGPARVPGWST